MATWTAEPSDDPEHVILAENVRMSYGGVEALRSVDLSVRRGEVYCILGPNGAGKTTLVEILEGYRDRTGGRVSVLGTDPQYAGAAWREGIGVVLQQSDAEPELTVRECLSLYAGYYRSPRPVDDTIALVGLEDKADVLGRRLSGGQRRRLDVALALIGDPELVFLDEPTTGFDPVSRRAAWAVLAGLRDLGKTILLTTHYLDEAEHLADRIAVIASGQVIAEGTRATIGGRDTATEIAFSLDAGVEPIDLPAGLGKLTTPRSDRVVIHSDQPLDALETLIGWCRARSHALTDLTVRRPTLEDIYLRLIEEHTWRST